MLSLGERCVIKLLNDIFISKPKSLILIDEIEMALHPIIQKRLYRVLEKIAEKESHLILVYSFIDIDKGYQS
ncbi:MAG: ATP-binding protein [Leptospiraceae bacterium]|nr:ATP-binding protein [Leptospiraceae bacterium]